MVKVIRYTTLVEYMLPCEEAKKFFDRGLELTLEENKAYNLRFIELEDSAYGHLLNQNEEYSKKNSELKERIRVLEQEISLLKTPKAEHLTMNEYTDFCQENDYLFGSETITTKSGNKIIVTNDEKGCYLIVDKLRNGGDRTSFKLQGGIKELIMMVESFLGESWKTDNECTEVVGAEFLKHVLRNFIQSLFGDSDDEKEGCECNCEDDLDLQHALLVKDVLELSRQIISDEINGNEHQQVIRKQRMALLPKLLEWLNNDLEDLPDGE